MAESANHSVHNSAADPPLIDVRGKTWRMTDNKQVLINGIVDRDSAPVVQLAYVNGTVWRQTRDLRWASKRHADDDWLPHGGSHHSPLGGQTNQEFEEVESGVSEVLEEVREIERHIDAADTERPAWVAGLIAAQAQLLLDYAATIAVVISQNQAATVLLLEAILAKIDTMGPPKPTAITLDMEHATHVPQPVPSGSGSN